LEECGLITLLFNVVYFVNEYKACIMNRY